MNRWRTYRMELFYRCAFLFGIAGSCALGVAHEQLFFSYTVVYIAYALIVPTMWVLSWSVVFMQKEGACRACSAASSACSIWRFSARSWW